MLNLARYAKPKMFNRDRLTQILLQIDERRKVLANPIVSAQGRMSAERQIMAFITEYMKLRAANPCPTSRGTIGQVSVEEETKIAAAYLQQMQDDTQCWEGITLSSELRDFAGRMAETLRNLIEQCKAIPATLTLTPTMRRLRLITPMVVSVIPVPDAPMAPPPASFVSPATSVTDIAVAPTSATSPTEAVTALSGLG